MLAYLQYASISKASILYILLVCTNAFFGVLRNNIKRLKVVFFIIAPLSYYTYLDDRLSACAILRSIKGELVDARKMRCSVP
jgi:hypothetical protein